MCSRGKLLYRALQFLLPLLLVSSLLAGGPRWVAGTSYFKPSVAGHPLTWANGVLNYYSDLGPLSATVTNSQANSMVAAAAQAWSGIPTAAVAIKAAGSLDEDVNGTNFFSGSSGLTMPADVGSTAVGKPLGIVYDADGSVLNALDGAGASDSLSCNTNGVTTLMDNYAIDATFAHALMIVNGLCATDAAHIAVLQYQLMRGFGRVLGLDWSQANDQMFPANITAAGLAGWPLMHPVEKLCNSSGAPCITGAVTPRTDDIAALNRLYPVTTANLTRFAGKKVTAAATISIHGTIRFRSGQGMQGVNAVARPLVAGTGQPDARYPAAAVSGALFSGNAGNAITGAVDASGIEFSRWGGADPMLEGAYDLSGIPLPPELTTSDYQLTFEALNPLYTGTEGVGPYSLGQVTPSGTMPVIIVRGLSAGSSVMQDVTIGDSAGDENSGDDGAGDAPATVQLNGEWMARLSGHGHMSWFRWHARANRQVTVEAQPVDERGSQTEDKARLVIGVWNGTDVLPLPPAVDTPQPFNAAPVGLTLLRFETGGEGDIRIGVGDQRGDGRSDYGYLGRVLYADTITPERISVNGGPITIDGMGFRPGNMVSVHGLAAQITSITPTEITAVAPASTLGLTGSVDVTVADLVTQGWTTMEGALSYDAATTDSIGIVSAPPSVLGIGAPSSLTVRTVSGDGATPAGGVNVTFSVTDGTATLGCGQVACTVVSSGDGLASIAVVANSTAVATVEASLANGASVRTQFTGGPPPAIAPLSGTLYLAAGAIFLWEPQAVVLNSGTPRAGQSVTWTGSEGVLTPTSSSTSDGNGLVSAQVTVGPLAPAVNATVNACLSGGVPVGGGCAAFTIASVHPEAAAMVAVNGVGQELSVNDTPAPVVVRVVDAAGHPMAGGSVNFYETLREWTPACPAQGGCPQGALIATQTVQSFSAADGRVTFSPLTQTGMPTRLDVLALTGDAGTLQFTIEQHP